MTRDEELAANYKAFEGLQPTLGPENAGKFALLRRGKLVEIFDSIPDAAIFAEAQFKDDLWSIQEIFARVVDLGWFSHAVPHRSV